MYYVLRDIYVGGYFAAKCRAEKRLCIFHAPRMRAADRERLSLSPIYRDCRRSRSPANSRFNIFLNYALILNQLSETDVPPPLVGCSAK